MPLKRKMNIHQVKAQWTLERLLSHLGHSPVAHKSKGQDLWYQSPFRPDEQEASFHIHTGKNIFKDFGLTGEGSGGDIITFGQTYLREQGANNRITDVLEWFSSIATTPTTQTPVKRSQPISKSQTGSFQLLSAKPIFSKALNDYLNERGISQAIGHKYLRQVYFSHSESKKHIYGVGMENRAGGYDVRNPLGFKGVVGPKAISYIPADTSTNTVEVFEGAFDFLSRREMYRKAQETPTADSIVLHSNMLYNEAATLIKEKDYTHVLLWLDNDEGGERGREALAKELVAVSTLYIQPKNEHYYGYKDLNEWWAAQQA